MKTRCLPLAASAVALALAHAPAQAEPAKTADKALVERGRYLVQIAGCNDCHTPGYMEKAGKVDETLWLTGDALGWRGPWGTTYATNLRLFVGNLSQAQWLQHVAAMRPRPPMPYFNLQAMNEFDRKALYVYLKSLGPAGQPAPAWVPPARQPAQPYIQFPG
jgi:mono/diheme cytochrome c family protein